MYPRLVANGARVATREAREGQKLHILPFFRKHLYKYLYLFHIIYSVTINETYFLKGAQFVEAHAPKLVRRVREYRLQRTHANSAKYRAHYDILIFTIRQSRQDMEHHTSLRGARWLKTLEQHKVCYISSL